jgi:RsiW-degrading membrane proteinase PrsW (M82 family)
VSTPTVIVLSLIAAFVPSLLYTTLVWWLDRYEREPFRLLAVAFAWGALPAVILSIVLEVIVGRPLAGIEPLLLQNVASASVAAPVIEELAKGLALLLFFLLARREFDNVLDGIVYGAVIGFGFAMTENALYFIEVLSRGQVDNFSSVVILRSLLFGLNHAFYTAIMGAGFGLAAQSRGTLYPWRWLFPLLGLVLAIGFHAMHNLGILLSESSDLALTVAVTANWTGVLLLFVIVLMAWQQERRWIIEELRSEVGDTLSQEEYRAAASYGRRLVVWLEAWQGDGWPAAQRNGHKQHLITRLAFLKRRERLSGAIPEVGREVTAIRAELRALRGAGFLADGSG